MSKNERKCFILGLLMLRLPFLRLPVSAFEKWGEFVPGHLLWLKSQSLLPYQSRTSQTSCQHCVPMGGPGKNTGHSSPEPEDTGKPVDASIELGPHLLLMVQGRLECLLSYVWCGLQS